MVIVIYRYIHPIFTVIINKYIFIKISIKWITIRTKYNSKSKIINKYQVENYNNNINNNPETERFIIERL